MWEEYFKSDIGSIHIKDSKMILEWEHGIAMTVCHNELELFLRAYTLSILLARMEHD